MSPRPFERQATAAAREISGRSIPVGRSRMHVTPRAGARLGRLARILSDRGSLCTTGFITLYRGGMTCVVLQLLFVQRNHRV